MLKPAFLYQEALQKLYAETALLERNKYYQIQYESFTIDIKDSTWDAYQFVSISKSERILGYLSVKIRRDQNIATAVRLLSFVDNSIVFANDVKNFFKLLISKGFRKISWCVVVGNPAERHYDRLCKKIGARIVGIYKDDYLIAGKIYDSKCYEYIC